MLCKNCGAEVSSSSKFCDKCGALLERENVSQITQISSSPDSEDLKGQESFPEETALICEKVQPNESVPPAEAVTPAKGSSAVEAPSDAPAAKKHNILLYVIIALVAIVAILIIFRNPSDSENSVGSSSGYNPASYNSGTSLSPEEELVVGTWRTVGISDNGNLTSLDRTIGSVCLYDDFTGSLKAGSIEYTFTWEYRFYSDGNYAYFLYTDDFVTLPAICDGEYFVIGDGDETMIFFAK